MTASIEYAAFVGIDWAGCCGEDQNALHGFWWRLVLSRFGCSAAVPLFFG